MCRQAAWPGRFSEKVDNLEKKEDLKQNPVHSVAHLGASGSACSSPPLDSKLGMPCMMTW